MFEKILDEIKNYNTVIIHRHAYPDGDALGSQIGLSEIIKGNYPGKKVYTVGDATKRYAFMDGAVMDEIPDEYYDGALAFVLDSAEEQLVSDKRFKSAGKTIRIDHHIYCETFTDIELVDTGFESCCGMITELCRESGLLLSQKGANALFTGMVTDTGRFRYDCTNARTFALASYLNERGVDSNSIYSELYSSDLQSVLLRAEFTKKIKLYENSPVAYIYTTREELEKLNTDPFSVSRGMVGLMADIKGIDIWVNFTEVKDKVWCELRSSKYNINPVAVKYGGGGHQKASGADVADFTQAMEMLSELKKLTENT